MNPLSIVTNTIAARAYIGEELSDMINTFNRPISQELTENERRCVADLRRDGFAVVQGYWPREEALKMRDRLEAYLIDGVSRDYESGAYLRFWDDHTYDEGVRRIYHVELLVEDLKPLRHDPFVLRVASEYYGVPIYSRVLTYQHNTKSNANTRYHHIDFFQKQFKAFIYLDDVDEGNGPFTYIRGTHRAHLSRIWKRVTHDLSAPDTTFDANDIGSALANETMVFGPAGTMILADVRGFHRGSPQLSGSRSALVNYLYTTPGDIFLDQ